MTCTSSSVKPQRRKLYGRKFGRPLRAERKAALESLLPALSIPEEVLEKPVDPTTLFPKSFDQYCLEIGFGNGEHLTALLNQYSDTAFIGVEPFVNGMATFLRDIKDLPQDNIRVLMDDALILTEQLTDESLDKIYILNPDPWPKKRHHKRRIVNQKNLDQFTRVLKPGGQLIMATDVDELAEWMVTECMHHPALSWTAESPQDWQTPPPEWIETRYAFKGRTAGRRQTFLIFEKTPCQTNKIPL